MIQLPPDFKELLLALNAAGVEYLIVGAYALAAYGRPRYTGDLDIWLAASPQNAIRVMNALGAYGVLPGGLSADDFAAAGQVIQLGYPPLRIDFLTSIDGVDFAGACARAPLMDLDGVQARVIGASDLITNKRATGRPRDLADIDGWVP